jgi:hypothetical protein
VRTGRYYLVIARRIFILEPVNCLKICLLLHCAIFDIIQLFLLFCSREEPTRSRQSLYSHLLPAVPLHQTRTLHPTRRCFRQQKRDLSNPKSAVFCATRLFALGHQAPTPTRAISINGRIADAEIGPHHTCRNSPALAMGPGSRPQMQ